MRIVLGITIIGFFFKLQLGLFLYRFSFVFLFDLFIFMIIVGCANVLAIQNLSKNKVFYMLM